MKNLAKYLALFLVVAVLAGVFAFTVFADDNASSEPVASTVGQYTAPEGAWTPADDSVYFAVWSTEADYLAGNVDPLTVGTTDEILEAHVGNKSDEELTYYVVLFKDCKTQKSAQLTTGLKTKLTFNLAGKTLTIANGFKIGNYSGTPTTAELTLENGFVKHNAGNMQLRRFSKLYVTNVDYSVVSACLDYDDNAALIQFKDSNLNVSGPAQFMFATNKNVVPCQVYFINTDVVTTNTTVPLFAINANKDTTTTEEIVNIRFDKDSSIKRDAAVPLVAINRSFVAGSDTPYYLSAPQNLIFEAGCVVSENIAPVEGQGYSYVVSHYNQSSGNWGPNNDKDTSEGRYTINYDGGFSHGEFAVRVVEPGTNQLISWTNEPVAGGVKLTAKASEGWTPDADHAGITFGVWASEDDFLAGEGPKYWSTTATVSTDEIGTTDGSGTTYGQDFVPGYVRLYTNITSVAGSQGQIITGGTQKLTIDLNGFTYTDAKGFRVGGSSESHPLASLTIKNGVYLRKNGQFHARFDSSIIFDRVSLIINTPVYDPATSAGSFENMSMFYGPGPDLVYFKDSSILILNGQNFGNLQYSKDGETVQKFIFENTDIEYGRYAPFRSLFRFTANSSYKSLVYDIYFDENSSIKGDFTKVGLVSIIDGVQSEDKIDINVYTELGFKFSDKAAPSFDCDYTAFGGTVEKLATSNADDAIFTWIIVNPDTTEEAVGAAKLAVLYGHYNGMYTYAANADEEYSKLYQFVELDADGKILRTWPVGTIFGFDSAAAKAPFKTANGATIKFYNDTVVSYTGTYQDYDVTFDLNGCTLYFTGTERFQFGFSMSGQWKERKVSFINTNTEKRGVLDYTGYTNSNNFVFQNRPGSIITFSDVDMKLKNSLFTEYGAKSITFKNVNFINTSGQSQTLIAGGFDPTTSTAYTNAGGVREIVFDGCVFDSHIYAARWTHTTYESNNTQVNYNDKIKVTVKGGTVLANDYAAPFTVAGIGVQSIELNIDADTRYTSFGAEAFRLEKGNATVNMNGYAVKALKLDAETGYYVPAQFPTLVAGDLQANLTLFTDFKVNFFTNPDKIVAIYNLDRAALEGIEFQGKVKYTSRYNVHEAADDKIYFIAIADGDSVVYVRLDYSVLAYAEALMASNSSDDSKVLVSAAMAYVSAAYTYADKIAPSFSGVDYEKLDLPENIADSNLTSAIKGVQLDLDSGFKLRFNIAEDYNGTLAVNGVSYEVVNGAYNGITYVNVELRAFELLDASIEIVAGEQTGAYSILNYIDFAVNSDDQNLIDLGYAIFDYIYYAKDYKANHPNLD